MTAGHKIYQLAYYLACFIVAAAFLSGIHKLFYPAEFALAVYRFHLLPDTMVNMAAVYLAWLEVVCAACLLFVPKYRVSALWLAAVLLTLFTAAIAINLLRGNTFSCGCFSSSPLARPMSWLHVARNLALTGLTLLALVSRRRAGLQ